MQKELWLRQIEGCMYMKWVERKKNPEMETEIFTYAQFYMKISIEFPPFQFYHSRVVCELSETLSSTCRYVEIIFIEQEKNSQHAHDWKE